MWVGDKGVHAFHKSVSKKMKVIVRLEIELAYYIVAVQHVSLEDTEILLTNNLYSIIWFQVFLSNTNNYMVSSNYFYLIIVICWHTVICFQETNIDL